MAKKDDEIPRPPPDDPPKDEDPGRQIRDISKILRKG
jgi:hypothetical protein